MLNIVIKAHDTRLDDDSNNYDQPTSDTQLLTSYSSINSRLTLSFFFWLMGVMVTFRVYCICSFDDCVDFRSAFFYT